MSEAAGERGKTAALFGRGTWWLAAGLLAIAIASTAHAEHDDMALPAARDGALWQRLAPTADGVQHARTVALEAQLQRTLTGWPGVERAEVQLYIPRTYEAALDRPLPPTRATVVLTRSSAQPSARAQPTRAQVLALLQGAAPSLAASELTLLEHASPAARMQPSGNALVTVGPFRVARESVTALRLTLGFSFAIHALFAGIVLWRVRPNRLVARKVDPRARTSFPP